MDLYKKAHLIVAAIRLLEYQKDNSPSIEKVCHMLSFSIEQGNLIVRRLKDLGVLILPKEHLAPIFLSGTI
jgi:hypothetical protein